MIAKLSRLLLGAALLAVPSTLAGSFLARADQSAPKAARADR